VSIGPDLLGYRLAMGFAAACVVLAVAGFAWMAIHDWREERRRKRRLYRVTTPAPRA
jgi:hypothetical protein